MTPAGSRSGSSPGDHLVGHSYGGVVALLAAARSGGQLRSLTVDRAALHARRSRRPRRSADVRARRRRALRARAAPRSRSPSCASFLTAVGSDFDPPTPLPPELEQGVRALRGSAAPGRPTSRSPTLAALGVPMLVVSGAHHPAFDAICDVLERESRRGAPRRRRASATTRSSSPVFTRRARSTSSTARRPPFAPPSPQRTPRPRGLMQSRDDPATTQATTRTTPASSASFGAELPLAPGAVDRRGRARGQARLDPALDVRLDLPGQTVAEVHRLCARRRSGGKLCGQPVDHELATCSGSSMSFSRDRAELALRDAVGRARPRRARPSSPRGAPDRRGRRRRSAPHDARRFRRSPPRRRPALPCGGSSATRRAVPSGHVVRGERCCAATAAANRVAGALEAEEERVALRVDLLTATGGELVADQPPVLGEHLGVPVAEPLQELRRACAMSVKTKVTVPPAELVRR